MITIGREFHFDTAHQLDSTGPEKCQTMHGHTYIMKVEATGEMDDETGMLIEFGAFKNVVNAAFVDKFDHNVANEVIRKLGWVDQRTTVENMTRYAALEIKKELHKLLGNRLNTVTVTMFEGLGAWATVTA